MFRGCLLSLLLLAALVIAYTWWLGPLFPDAHPWVLGGIVGLVVFFCIGALSNAWQAWGDWTRVSAARYGMPLDDGHLVAVSGKIVPIGQALRAPFTQVECVICEYDLGSPRPHGTSDGGSQTGSDYAGFLMTPCKIESPSGDVRLLGFPLLEGFTEDHYLDAYSAANARKFLQTTAFENRTGLKVVTLLSVFGEVWSDDDGEVAKHLQLTKATVEDIFPAEVDAEVATWKLTERAGEDEDDEDLAPETESGEVYTPTAMPKMIEKRVPVGQQVCAFGVYDQARGGLIRRPGSMTANRLVQGSADAVEKQLRSKLIANGLGGLIVLLLVHGAIFGAHTVYQARLSEAAPVEARP